MKKKLAVFISGRGSNMKAIIEACQTGILKELAEIVLVFSNKPSAAGLETAKAAGLAVLALPSKGKKRNQFDQEVVDVLSEYDLDYIILAGYMRILSSVLVDAYQGRIINIHPADTQQHQGLNGYQWAFEQGLKATKITVHYVDEGLDTGSIIEQYPVDLSHVTTLEEVERRGLAVEHANYSRAIKRVIEAN
ncbi:MAG: phosphoribosylglycinamide formyltransferase [Aureispira sp.]